MKKSRFLPFCGLTKTFALPRIIVCREAGLSFAVLGLKKDSLKNFKPTLKKTGDFNKS